MKFKKFSTSIAVMVLAWNIGFSQDYCIPPPFKNGPFTGIESIKLAGMENVTPYDGGYANFVLTGTSGAKDAELKAGSSYPVDLRFYYDPSFIGSFSGKLNFRIWVDWNQDFDFDDPNETVLSKEIDCNDVTVNNPTVTVSFQIDVPSGVKAGNTRMRIYNDMLPSDGHIEPIPCGYIDDTGPIGQHGECEDYRVIVSSTVSIDEPKRNLIQVYPNPFSQMVYFSETVKEINVFNVLGVSVRRGENLNSIDLGDLPKGIFLITYKSKEGLIRTVRMEHI